MTTITDHRSPWGSIGDRMVMGYNAGREAFLGAWLVHSYRLDKLSLARTPPGRPPGALRYLPFLLTALIAIALSLGTSSAHSASRPPTTLPTVADKSNQGTSLGTVTIEATQARRELQRRVDHYVASGPVSRLMVG